MKIKKAVILAAGYGTRMLPASKVVPKELLPVLDTPAIQIVVEEIVASGITDIVMVISRGKGALLDHFAPAPDLEQFLVQRGKRDLLEVARKTSSMAHITPVEQTEALGIGHAVLQVKTAVGDEPFAVLLPDDICDCARPCLRQLMDVAEERDGPVVALMRVARADVSKYGIVEGAQLEERLYRLSGMVEKPTAEKAPSEMAIIGRYLLPPEIFAILGRAAPGHGGEIQLTDALLELGRKRNLYGYEFEGTRHDMGDRLGFLTAQIAYGLRHPQLADKLRSYLATIISSKPNR
ncbi:MAG TPA: UTP--glucose-1-phosphate uridylyltransferase [Candidatus Binataceae bacterium]|nr:UTP--glucose-1-phosphate uridylyltransferase [Candidatus Binataceae bacterium]